MKRLPIYAAFFLFIIAARAAEAPASPQEQLMAMVNQVQAQQKAIAENEAKIEAKLAAVAESLRVAKIYSTRAGGK